MIPKAEMTVPSMLRYSNEAAVPCCAALQPEFRSRWSSAYLVMNNSPMHSRDDFMNLEADNIKPVWFPAHSTHFVQSLNVGIFGAYEMRHVLVAPTIERNST
jgi:hypothetical protein